MPEPPSANSPMLMVDWAIWSLRDKSSLMLGNNTELKLMAISTTIIIKVIIKGVRFFVLLKLSMTFDYWDYSAVEKLILFKLAKATFFDYTKKAPLFSRAFIILKYYKKKI